MTNPTKPGYESGRTAGSFSWQQGVAWILACAALVAALAAAYTLGRSHAARPPGVEIVIPTPSPIFVQVSGGVQSPGLVRLPRGDRIANAIEAAGGVTQQADLATLNLAAFVVDGMHVRIPTRDEPGDQEKSFDRTDGPTVVDDSLTPDGEALPTPAVRSSASLLNINTANAVSLTELPGIGPVRAEAIVAFRESRGGFASVDELAGVAGIGPATVEQLRPLVTVQ